MVLRLDVFSFSSLIDLVVLNCFLVVPHSLLVLFGISKGVKETVVWFQFQVAFTLLLSGPVTPYMFFGGGSAFLDGQSR